MRLILDEKPSYEKLPQFGNELPDDPIVAVLSQRNEKTHDMWLNHIVNFSYLHPDHPRMCLNCSKVSSELDDVEEWVADIVLYSDMDREDWIPEITPYNLSIRNIPDTFGTMLVYLCPTCYLFVLEHYSEFKDIVKEWFHKDLDLLFTTQRVSRIIWRRAETENRQ